MKIAKILALIFLFSNPLVGCLPDQKPTEEKMYFEDFLKRHQAIHHIAYGLAQLSVGLAINYLVLKTDSSLFDEKRLEKHQWLMTAYMVNDASHGILLAGPTTFASTQLVDGAFDYLKIPKPEGYGATEASTFCANVLLNTRFYEKKY